MRRLKTVRRPPIYPKTPGHLPCSSLTHPLPLPSRRPSVSFCGFGLRVRLAEVGLKSFESPAGADEYRRERDGFSFTINMQPLSPALVKVNV